MVSDLYNALRPYIDAVGLVQDSPGGRSGNGILYTAEAVIRLHDLGSLTPEIRSDFRVAISDCEIAPGFFRRHPEHFSTDQVRQDDYLALAALSKYLDWPELARLILEYGQRPKTVFPPLPWPRTRYYYPNERGWDHPWYPEAWIGAYPACIATLKQAAGNPLTGHEQDWINYAVEYGPNRKNPSDRDSYILAWIILRTANPSGEARQGYWRQMVAANYWDIATLLGAYFRDKNHPLGAHWSN